MRPIEFKGQMSTGEWVYGLPSLDLPHSTAYWNEASCRIGWHNESGGQSNAPIMNDTLCQYTGLEDKNKVKIFENDVWVFSDIECDFKLNVVFENGSFVCYHTTLKDWDGKPLRWGLLSRAYELGDDYLPIVIGNTIDNPELLEAK